MADRLRGEVIINAIETGKADWSPSRAPATMKEMLDIYDEQSADVIRRWKALPPARWEGALDTSFSSSDAGVATA